MWPTTPGRTLTVIDFSHVGLLDYSCANEVVAKLLLRFATETPPSDAYFVFRGMQEWHLDAIEAALVAIRAGARVGAARWPVAARRQTSPTTSSGRGKHCLPPGRRGRRNGGRVARAPTPPPLSVS